MSFDKIFEKNTYSSLEHSINSADNQYNKQTNSNIIDNNNNETNNDNTTAMDSSVNIDDDLAQELVKCILFAIIKDENIKRDKIQISIQDMVLQIKTNKLSFDEFKKYNIKQKNEFIKNICNCDGM